MTEASPPNNQNLSHYPPPLSKIPLIYGGDGGGEVGGDVEIMSPLTSILSLRGIAGSIFARDRGGSLKRLHRPYRFRFGYISLKLGELASVSLRTLIPFASTQAL